MKRKVFLRIGIIASIFIFVSLFVSKYTNLNTFQDEIDSLNEQIAAEEEYSKELDKTAKMYTSDEYVEQYARGLGLVKPNEKIFRNYNDKK